MDATLTQILFALYERDRELTEVRKELVIVKEALTTVFNDKTALEKRLNELIEDTED